MVAPGHQPVCLSSVVRLLLLTAYIQQQVARGSIRLLMIFIDYCSYRYAKSDPITDWTTVTHDQFNNFRMSNDYMFAKNVPGKNRSPRHWWPRHTTSSWRALGRSSTTSAWNSLVTRMEPYVSNRAHIWTSCCWTTSNISELDQTLTSVPLLRKEIILR